MGSKGIDPSTPSGWAAKEFGLADFGDPRLTSRLIKIADSFSEAPEDPINQACNSWAETKGAYRFFKNDSVSPAKILSTHVLQTMERAEKRKIVLAIQDTSYFSWRHEKTKGLGIISRIPGHNVDKITSKGVVMHTSFGVTTEGLPIGILDQKIYARKPMPEELKKKKREVIMLM